MRKSQRNTSKLSRVVYYKYSGPMVFIPIIILAVGVYSYMEYEREFFTAWSCETIGDYLLGENVPPEFPKHNDITDEQHIKLHRIIDECNAQAKFSEKMSHD